MNLHFILSMHPEVSQTLLCDHFISNYPLCVCRPLNLGMTGFITCIGLCLDRVSAVWHFGFSGDPLEMCHPLMERKT